jgi:bacillithiol biosynthesis cysteine-adding enzyme BshC
MPLSLLGSVPYPTGGFGNQLTADWVDHFAKVKALFRRDPRNTADWDTLLTELQKTTYARAELAKIPGLEKLAQPNTFVIATGQQPGLFGGPLYNLYKALTAIKLARELNAKYAGRAQFIPLFWVASDDHDLDEISHAEFFDAQARVQSAMVGFAPQFRGSEAQFVTIDEQLSALETRLKTMLAAPNAEHLVNAYRSQNMGVAFSQLLREWLGELGLIVMEGCQVRPLARELFVRELDQFAKSSEAIRKGAEAQQAAGYAPEFTEEIARPHLFSSMQGVRARLEAEGAGSLIEHSPAFKARGLKPLSLSVEDWKKKARETPELFSANAAFRSIVQNRTLPVAAVILGPGELNYWAQLGPLHDHYQTPWPILVPRASFTLLDATAQKAARKLGLGPLEVFADKDTLSKRLFAGSELEKAVNAHCLRILNETNALLATVTAHDKGVESLFAKMKMRFEHELNRAARVARENATNKEQAGEARLNYLSGYARPGGQPQERVLSAAQFMAQYPTLCAELLEMLDPLDFRHHVIGL